MVFAILLMLLLDAEVDINAIMPSCYNILRKVSRKISVTISNITCKIANSQLEVTKHKN